MQWFEIQLGRNYIVPVPLILLLSICLSIDGDICFNKETIADSFTFNTTVASKLFEKLPAIVNKFGKSFVTKCYANLGMTLNNYSFSLL